LIAPTMLRVVLTIALCVFACTAWGDPGDASIDSSTAERQILVMLRAPPPHFRPDANYLGSYDSQMSRVARKRVAEGLAAQFKLRIVDSWPMPALGVDCFVMEAAEKVAMARLVEDMSRDTRVESIQSMNLFRLLAHDDPLFPLQPTAKLWHLSEIHQIATGRNVRIAAIDSGVELDHPDLQRQVRFARNFVDARDSVAESHGTAVAGIIAARADNGIGIVGVAPQAALMALRACWQPGPSTDSDPAVCSSFTLAKALQFALDKNAHVINLSLGGPRDRLLERLLNVAVTRGTVIVAAADPKIADGGFPASVPGVLAVAADNAHDSPPAIFLAPGRDIPATLPGQRFGMVNGSSFAAAEMAGLVALLLELGPNQKPHQIRETLATSQPTASSSSRRTIVDACAAIARTAGTCACGCAVARAAGPSP
jgi:subtilisin family serine protease